MNNEPPSIPTLPQSPEAAYRLGYDHGLKAWPSVAGKRSAASMTPEQRRARAKKAGMAGGTTAERSRRARESHKSRAARIISESA